MDARTRPRGSHFLTADRRFATGAGLFARLLAPGFRRVLDRIDAGLDHGRIDALLPGGARRTLGGRAPGPVAEVEVRSWRALVRPGRRLRRSCRSCP